jgi:hypothetical protein
MLSPRSSTQCTHNCILRRLLAGNSLLRCCIHSNVPYQDQDLDKSVIIETSVEQYRVIIQLSQPNFNPIQSWCDHIIKWNPPLTQTLKHFQATQEADISVCNLILTQLDEMWKTTSIFLKMEDAYNFF